jgi:hypothetical protein
MTDRLINFLEAIAPLAKSSLELEDIVIICFLENQWNNKKQVKVNDIVNGISNISASNIHRRLKKLRKQAVLYHQTSENDWRVKFILKGENYQKNLLIIKKLYDKQFLQKL